MASKKRYTKIDRVTPKMAQKMLSTMVENRNHNLGISLELGREMIEGKWMKSGDTIKFEGEPPNERLFDGQHRLHAIIEMNIAMELILVYNCEPGSIKVTDIGKKRQAWENLSLSGSPIKKNHQTMINRALGLVKVEKIKNTVQDIEEFFLEHQEKIEFIADIMFEGKPKRGVQNGQVAGAILATWIAIEKIDEDIVREFCTILKSGVSSGRKKDITIITIRDWLVSDTKANTKKRAQMVAYFMAAFAKNRPLTIVKPAVMNPSFFKVR